MCFIEKWDDKKQELTYVKCEHKNKEYGRVKDILYGDDYNFTLYIEYCKDCGDIFNLTKKD